MDDAFKAVRCGGKLLEGANAEAVAEKKAVCLQVDAVCTKHVISQKREEGGKKRRFRWSIDCKRTLAASSHHAQASG
jgi:hypothetical protein